MKMKNVPFSENGAIFGGRASGRLEMGVWGVVAPRLYLQIFHHLYVLHSIC